MTCIIIDDEPHAIDILSRYVEETSLLDLKGTFRNPLKALTFVQDEPIDLIFLDVNMPNLTGIQFLSALKEPPMVIFTTAYSTYAAESYEWNAIDYLLKPIVLERFLKSVNKAYDRSKKNVIPNDEEMNNGFVLLKSGNKKHKIRIKDITYIIKDSNYLEVHTFSKKILVRSNMIDIFSWLPKTMFCRVHKSYVVSLKHIEEIEYDRLKVNNMIIPIGVSYRKEFLKKLEN